MTNDPASAADTTIRQGPDPVVRRPAQALPGAAIAAGALCLALLLFAVLNAQRRYRAAAPPAAAVASVDTFRDPPPLRLPSVSPEPQEAAPARLPLPTVIIEPAPPPKPLPQQAPLAPAPRFSSPIIVPARQIPYAPPAQPAPRDGKSGSAIVFDLGVKVPAATSATRPAETGDDTPLKAGLIASRTDLVPAGTQIPIVLETPIDTSRPGLARAIASDDTRGFDGRRVLIPRGSRFIGEYQGDIRSGQNRVLVTWLRVICPDGTTIRLASPAADQLGGAGVPGKVNSFFLQRFAGAVLQSALSFGTNLAYRSRSNSVIVGVPSAPIASIGQGLVPNDYRPKITVKQGALLNIFVARDLDFSSLAVGQP